MARIRCSFVLSGELLDPAQVTRALGVVPTSCWKKGDAISPGTRRRKDNGWKFSIEDSDGGALETVLEALLRALAPSKEAIASYLVESNIEAEFACAIYLGTASPIPSMHLDHDIIATLGEYRAQLDIDVYPNPTD